jgi:hypothetical protein
MKMIGAHKTSVGSWILNNEIDLTSRAGFKEIGIQYLCSLCMYYYFLEDNAYAILLTHKFWVLSHSKYD